VFGDPRAQCHTFPKVQGETVEVYRNSNEDGPWWDLLREELPKMEQELREHLRSAQAKKDEEDSKKAIERAERMEQAKKSISSWKAK
jgi:FMN-dependent NADH-azoreductase